MAQKLLGSSGYPENRINNDFGLRAEILLQMEQQTHLNFTFLL